MTVIGECDDVDSPESLDGEAGAAEFIDAWEGRPCTEALEERDTGSLWTCHYGIADILVCDQSAGLPEVGCNCEDGTLSCANGYTIKQAQEGQTCRADGGL